MSGTSPGTLLLIGDFAKSEVFVEECYGPVYYSQQDLFLLLCCLNGLEQLVIAFGPLAAEVLDRFCAIVRQFDDGYTRVMGVDCFREQFFVAPKPGDIG